MDEQQKPQMDRTKELCRTDAEQGLRLVRAFQKLSPASREEILKMVESRADNQTT